MATTLQEFQADLRHSYVGGGVGAIVSGVVWAVAALISAQQGIAAGFAALFLGGMLIFPLGTLICRTVFRRKTTHPDNPGGRIVVETLPGMFVGLFIAYLFVGIDPDRVFPIAAMAVGAHYFNFRTAYGDATYWVLGGSMMAVGTVEVLGVAQIPFGTAVVVAFLEVAFGLVLTIRSLSEQNPVPAR